MGVKVHVFQGVHITLQWILSFSVRMSHSQIHP